MRRERRRVIVVGGGVAGLVVANRLAASPDPPEVRLYSAAPRHDFQAALLGRPLGARRPPGHPIGRLLDRRVRFEAREATALDAGAGWLELAGGERLAWDALVLAPGAHPCPRRIPGFREGAYHFHCAKRAEHLRAALARWQGGDLAVGASALPYKCPTSPHEFALRLADWLGRRGLAGATRLVFVHPLAATYPDPAVGARLVELLRARGIAVRGGFALARVEPRGGGKRLVAASGEEVECGLAVLAPPHGAVRLVTESDLPRRGDWVRADPRTLEVRPGVFCLGDAADLPAPKSGSAARRQAAVAAANVLSRLAGEPLGAAYDGGAT